MFGVYIFPVTQCPAHPVELHHVEILTCLRLHVQNSVRFNVSSTKDQRFANAEQETGIGLLSKPQLLQDVRCKRDVIKCLILIQVRAYKRKARNGEKPEQFTGSVLSDFNKRHVCCVFAAC